MGARARPRRQRLHEECNQRARGLAGAERRGFMTQCEKGEAALEATSEYMKGCLDGAAEASR